MVLHCCVYALMCQWYVCVCHPLAQTMCVVKDLSSGESASCKQLALVCMRPSCLMVCYCGPPAALARPLAPPFM